jgi:CheY-like chemotaxis protein
MNGVIGSLELMETVEMDAELTQYQQTAAGSARDMMRMVNGMLTLTELQAGKLKVYPAPFSLRGVIDALQVQFGANAVAKGLDFKVDIGPGLADRLVGDSGKLAQCLECLLDNAIKFTRSGGVALRVSGRPSELDRLVLSFAVIDTGIGFTDLGEATLYQRFFQLDGSMTREYGGLGVGLAICRQLVELLGGRLTHISEPGRGSRFQLDVEFDIALPMAISTPFSFSGRRDPRQPQDCTVLLADDNTVDQLVMRGMLLKLGYRVRTADNGRAALDLLQGDSFDAVLLDCQSAPPDGVSLCCQIRALSGCEDLPLLVVSPNIEQERCPSGALVDYLSKPVKFEVLQAILQRRVLCPKQGESADI